jgi:hypothetical protein
LQLFQGMDGINDDRNGAEFELLGQLFVGEESMKNRPWVGHPGGLDDERVVAVALASQPSEGEPQIRARSAADAAVAGLQGCGPGEQILVDTNLSEFVLQDGQPPRREVIEQVAKQRGLSGPEEAGQEQQGG